MSKIRDIRTSQKQVDEQASAILDLVTYVLTSVQGDSFKAIRLLQSAILNIYVVNVQNGVSKKQVLEDISDTARITADAIKGVRR